MHQGRQLLNQTDEDDCDSARVTGENDKGKRKKRRHKVDNDVEEVDDEVDDGGLRR